MSDKEEAKAEEKPAAAEAAPAKEKPKKAPAKEKEKPAAEEKVEAAEGAPGPNERAAEIEVQTTGSFGLVEPITRQDISHEGTTTIRRTPAVARWLEQGKLEEV